MLTGSPARATWRTFGWYISDAPGGLGASGSAIIRAGRRDICRRSSRCRDTLKVAVLTPGNLSVKAIPDDPADGMVLACALEGQADFIVSGDHHLTDLKNYQGIKIVDPVTFLSFIIQEQ